MQGSGDACVAKDSVATTMHISSIECPIGKAYIQGSDANCSLDRNTVTLSDSSASAVENLSVGAVVGFVDIAHLGDGSDIVSFTLSDDEYFEVNASGVIKLIKALDYETIDEYNLTVVVTNGAGMSTRVKLDIEVLKIASKPPKLVEPTYITEFTYSGDANWIEDNTTYYSPTGSWKNEDIGDSQSACMEVSVDESADTSLSFVYKVSSESNWDKLKFYIDDSEQNSYSGEIDWTSVSQTISSGSHTLKWCYSKDSSASSGSDTAWVDDIAIGGMQHYTLAEDEALGIVGAIGIVPQDDATIDSFTIDGNGSEKFEVATDGTLFLVAKLDYETQRAYTLRITAHNTAGASNTVTRTIEVTDVDDLYITNAFYDKSGTPEPNDDKLYLQYSKTLDETSIVEPIADNYVINEDASIDDNGIGSSGEYNSSRQYYPHIIYLGDALEIVEQNISIADATLTDLAGVDADTAKTVIRAVTGSSVVKKTGQIKSYDESGAKAYHQSIKDDGYYQSGVAPRYSRDDAAEIVTDHITGLMWADDASVSSVTKQWLTDENYATCSNDTSDPACYDTSSDPADPDDDTATEYCEALTLGGFSDWRLPSRKELVGLSDYGRVTPAINPIFNNIASSNYWSSTTYAGNSSYAWYVGFYDGRQYYYYKSNSSFVRCVRAGQL